MLTMEFIYAKLQENQLIIGKTMHKQHVKGFMSAATPCPEEFSISCCKAMIPLWLIRCLMTQCEIFMFASYHLVKIQELVNQRNLNLH